MKEAVDEKLKNQELTKDNTHSKKEILVLDYIVNINNDEANHPKTLYHFLFPKFQSNYIRTTKYRWWYFLPLNIFEQLRRLSNIYFILVMIFALIPGVSPIFPITSILPVCFILGTTAVKDGFEDLMRFLGDKKINDQKFTIIKNGKEIQVCSSQVKVGDIIKIQEDDMFPCDLLFLSSNDPHGICFVSTLNLNGESNLKLHSARECTKLYNTPEKLSQLKGIVSCEKPRFELEILNSKLKLQDNEEETLSIKNILLRGSVLKNTEHIYGLVLYCGKQTKLSLNAEKPKYKLSLLDKKLNRFMFFILLFHLTLDITMVVAYVLYQVYYSNYAFYLQGYNYTPNFLFVLYAFFTVFILNNLLIPMSLFVSLEFIKAFQAKFMNWDLKLSDIDKKTQEFRLMYPNTSNLNEDLSQIEFIFSDKTGTLTENIMNFKKCSIGMDILHDEDKEKTGLFDIYKSKQNLEENEKMNFLKHFLYNITLCNTINTETNKKGELLYDGSSIDEVALVNGARNNHFTLLERNGSKMKININGDEEIFEILETIEFNSDRKRMSVIIKTSKNKFYCYSKGADNIITKILQKDDPILEHTLKQCDIYAKEGLRTLLFAYKELSHEEYNEWKEFLKIAQSSVEEKTKKIAMVHDRMEKDLILLGASAIEDLLQDEVPETIDFFRKAGVQVWVLTGDKRDTAVSIGKSSKLLTENTIEAHIQGKTIKEVETELQNCYLMAQQPNSDVAIILDTDTLNIAYKNLSKLFLMAIKHVSCAICCRVTPLQKALVVRIVQRKFKKIGLAIGDGANDVSMISAAKVGVGIMGREGSQAARSADYAIPRFKHLKRLLAVHGRYSLVRNAYFIQYSFYKNMNLTLLQVLFSIFCLFTSTSILDSWFLNLYNMIFNLLFPIGSATFEKDFKEEELESNPLLYKEIKSGLGYRMNYKTFLGWIFQSVYHSVIMFFFAYAISMEDGLLENAIDDIYVLGFFFGAVVHVVNTFKAILEMTEFNFLMISSYIISMILFIGWLLFYSAFPIFYLDGHSNYYNLTYFVFSKSKFWIYLLLCVICCFIPDLCYKVISNTFWKEKMKIIAEQGYKSQNVIKEKMIELKDVKNE